MPETAPTESAMPPQMPTGARGTSWMTTQWWLSEDVPSRPKEPKGPEAGKEEEAMSCWGGWTGREGVQQEIKVSARKAAGSASVARLPPSMEEEEEDEDRAREDEGVGGPSPFPTELMADFPPVEPRGTGADDFPLPVNMSQGQRIAARKATVPKPAPKAEDDDDIDVVGWDDVMKMRSTQVGESDARAQHVDASGGVVNEEDEEEEEEEESLPPGEDDDDSLPGVMPGAEVVESFSPEAAAAAGDTPDDDTDSRGSEGPRRQRRVRVKRKIGARAAAAEASSNESENDQDGRRPGGRLTKGRLPTRPCKNKKPSHCFIVKSAVVRLCDSAVELKKHCLAFKDERRGAGQGVQWSAESGCLGAVGTVHCVYPSGAVGVAFPDEKQRLKLPPAALTLYCGPVRGHPDTTPEEAVWAAEVAEALRSHRGFWLKEDFLPASDAEEVYLDAKKLCEDDESMIQGGTGTGGGHRRDGVLRGDSIRWMPKQSLNATTDSSLPESLQRLQEKLHRLRKALSQGLKKPLTRTSIQLARYPGEGRGYVKHRDVKLGNAKEGLDRRRITCLYYCNKDWTPEQGGELAHYPQTRNPRYANREGDSYEMKAEKQKEVFAERDVIEPKLNSLLIFQSHVYHEVLPDFAPRIAFTFWMYGSESLGLTYPGADEDMDAGLGMPGPPPALGADLKLRNEITAKLIAKAGTAEAAEPAAEAVSPAQDSSELEEVN